MVKNIADFNEFEDETLVNPLQRDLIKLLRKNGPMTRSEIIAEISIARTTVYDNLMGLIAHNIVKKSSCPRNHRGRPKVVFTILRDRIESLINANFFEEKKAEDLEITDDHKMADKENKPDKLEKGPNSRENDTIAKLLSTIQFLQHRIDNIKIAITTLISCQSSQTEFGDNNESLLSLNKYKMPENITRESITLNYYPADQQIVEELDTIAFPITTAKEKLMDYLKVHPRISVHILPKWLLECVPQLVKDKSIQIMETENESIITIGYEEKPQSTTVRVKKNDSKAKDLQIPKSK